MYRMFYKATEFNSDVSNWDVSSATDMNSMFKYATEFNSDVSSWDVSNVIYLDGMFNGASEFNQQMCGWTVIDTKLNAMFDGSLCSVESCLECTEE